MPNTIKTIKNELLGEFYQTTTHKSGLRIYLSPKELSTTYALFSTQYGAIDTMFRKSSAEDYLSVPDGVAHFLEHKMFENEDGVDTFARFSAFGASSNAYTSHDQTSYLFSATDNLKENLHLLIDFVSHPYFTNENVAKEQGIIGQEIDMYRDNPSSALYYAVLECLFHFHPMKIDIAGTKETISHITPEILYQCYHTFYHPSNMTLAVSGRMTMDEILDICDAILPEQVPIAIQRKQPDEPKEVAKKRTRLYMQVAEPMIAIGVKDNETHLSVFDRERRAIMLTMLSDMLFAESAPFSLALYNSGVVSTPFSVGYEYTDGCAFQYISTTGKDPEKVLACVKDYIADISQNPPAKDVFERIKRSMYADYIREFDSTDDIATNLTQSAFLGMDLYLRGEMILSITYDDIIKTMREFYQEKTFVMATVEPKMKGTTTNNADGVG